MKAQVSIRVERVSKRLGPNQALDSVDLEFEPAMLHGLIGPEGAGKTTLLRTICGLLKPDHGGVRFTLDGRPVEFGEVRPQIAYMPQQQSLYADLSIDEHLEFFRDLYRIPPREYEEQRSTLLRITRLDKFADRAAGQLSGGMYKKLGLMCALLRSPSVVLLDEPTNGVDPISRREFWELLYGLAEQRILILFATAYMDEAERCGRVHLLNAGRTIDSGEPRELLEREGVRDFDSLFIRKELAPGAGGLSGDFKT